jgi:APA family basic amino acid/polyamine antiporter
MSVPLPRPASPPPPVTATDAPSRSALGLRDAIGLIVGTMIGAGIFRTPSLVAEHTGSAGLALLAWAAGGAISLMGALCYAELAAAYPNTGGDYHYLTRAFGRRVGFLFAWARMTVIQTGAIAVLAFVLGDYAAQLFPLGAWSSPVYAALVVIVLTVTNIAGVRHGAVTQNTLTALEIGGFVLLGLVGLAVAGPAAAVAPVTTAVMPPPAFGLVMVFVLLSYGGWSEAAYLSGEVRDPARTMVRALVWSLTLVTALYVLLNWSFFAALGADGVARSNAVAADVVRHALGIEGARLAGILVVIAALTSLNAAIFTGARSAWALGRDFGIARRLGCWDATRRTPVNALLAQGIIALALVALGATTRKGFETMVEYTAPVFWLFICLTGVALFVLRRREPTRPRPFRVPLYPLTPLVFCATSAYLVYSSLAYTGVGALVGVGVLAAGVLVLCLTSAGAAHDTRPRP